MHAIKFFFRINDFTNTVKLLLRYPDDCNMRTYILKNNSKNNILCCPIIIIIKTALVHQMMIVVKRVATD